MNKMIVFVVLASILFSFCSCIGTNEKTDIILDTDANNEVDDQHALAYLLLDEDDFNLLGITVNATRQGGDISEHFKEAERVVALCDKTGTVKIFKGAKRSFLDIKDSISNGDFDGKEAVDFIIRQAKLHSSSDKLTVIAIGKLTNIALALMKAPDISDNIRLIWLGSNYPAPGEYNLEDDIPSMNYVLDSDIHFELVPCRYNEETGTDAVKITLGEIRQRMPGLGPEIDKPVDGRNGGEFNRFGDYSIDLFVNYLKTDDDSKSRPLFDMAAVAIVKNPEFAQNKEIIKPMMVDGEWQAGKDSSRKMILWENFDRDKIIEDFFNVLQKAQ